MAVARDAERRLRVRSNQRMAGGKPDISRFERENEAAGDRAEARSQAMKMI
jgi:hypothetical protein